MSNIPTIEEQWETWIAANPVDQVPDITDEQLRSALIADLEVVSKMPVGEYTLYQKWCEVQEKFPSSLTETLFGSERIMKDPSQKIIVDAARNNIWRPESPDDYLKLKPTLIITDDSVKTKSVDMFGGDVEETSKRTKDLPLKWNAVRTFTSTMKNNSNIGRNMNFMVVDEITGKYLGVVCISSDFLDLTPRDKYIGWEREKKTQGHMINYTAIGSSIVPTQPLGFNYVGGKLLALLCLSDTVQKSWKELYGDVLVGVTTTSLYGKSKAGGLSQYDNLKHWKKMGYSSGSMAFESSKPTQKMIRQWLHKHHTKMYFEWYGAKKGTGQPYKRDHRNRSYHFTYRKLGIPSELIRCEHQRGIYFSPLYTNTNEFLCGKIDDTQLVKLFDTSEEYLTNLWKEKYAAKRIESLRRDNRVSTETLFYDDLIYMDWEQVKEKYLTQVGR